MRHPIPNLATSKCPSCGLSIDNGEEYFLKGQYYHDLCAIRYLLQLTMEHEACPDRTKK